MRNNTGLVLKPQLIKEFELPFLNRSLAMKNRQEVTLEVYKHWAFPEKKTKKTGGAEDMHGVLTLLNPPNSGLYPSLANPSSPPPPPPLPHRSSIDKLLRKSSQLPFEKFTTVRLLINA